MIGMLGLCSEAHAKLIVALQPVPAGSRLAQLIANGEPELTTILDQVIRVDDTFEYNSVAHCQVDLRMRVAEANFMGNTYEFINGVRTGGSFDYWYPDSFESSIEFCDWCWVPIHHDPREKTPMREFQHRMRTLGDFGLTPKTELFKPPSWCLDKLKNGRTRADCLTAMFASMALGIHSAKGPDWCDKNLLIPKDVWVGLRFHQDFCKFVPVSETHLVIGDGRSLRNKDDYIELCEDRLEREPSNWKPHPGFMMWQGINVIVGVGGPDRFGGLGLLRMTEAELREQLRLAYIRDTGKQLLPHEACSVIRWTSALRLKILDE